MKHVSNKEFDLIVQWIKHANNYKGISRHDVDGTGYCLEINGRTIEVAWTGPDDLSDDMLYLVNKDMYRYWKENFGGYKITF